jgi:hypothetical protein
MEKNPKARRRTFLAQKAIYSGQGELHGLLAALQITPAEFCRRFGVPPRTFHGWEGHPLHAWPLNLLRWYARAQAMGQRLAQLGYDLRAFEPEAVTENMPTGRYPRTAAQAPRFDEGCLPSVTLRWCEVCRRNTPRIDEAPCTH